ncbi:hypothetical protein J0H58_08895 [bacterium]|nr:hypothetical protein [bacterium]
MTANKWYIVIGCAGGFVAGVVVTSMGLASRPKPAGDEPPSVGGQKAPATVREIDFDKRYDVYCSFFEKEPTVFRGSKVVGFTGPANAGQEVGGGSGLSSRGYYQHFDRWLVIEQADGRLAYIPPNSLRYLEAAKNP